MSKYIATRAIRGANALVTEADVMLNKALAEKGADTPVSFPNTAYYLPTILGMTGKSIEKIGDLKSVMDYTRGLLHPVPAGRHWTPYLGETLDSGMATLLAAETIEAIRFVYGLQPEPMPETLSSLEARHYGARQWTSVISMDRLTIFNSARGVFNSWTVVCPVLPRSLDAQNPTKSRSRSCANYNAATS